MNTGLIGELQVEQRLVEHGWHPLRLDTAQMASNADLLAVNRRQRVSIQVKTTDAGAGHSHARSLMFGYATGYIEKGTSIFNSKESPLVADVIVAVGYTPVKSRFVVMPVGYAENICRAQCDWWYSVPTQKGEVRSSSFPIYLSFAEEKTSHKEHHADVRRRLSEWEDRWDVLDLPIDDLHDRSRWPLT